MPKILSKTGDSLADVYDVEGSIAGVDELLSEEINLVHEMGGTAFSERLSTRMFSISSGAIAQSIAFNVNFSENENARVLGVQVITTTEARVSHVQVSITSPPGVDNQECPIWGWESTKDTFRSLSMLVGGAIVSRDVLVPAFSLLPNLLVGPDSPRSAQTLTIRGAATAFGAGTVTIQALLYLAFPQTAGLSSRGLPLPGW